MPRHILTASQFTREQIKAIFARTDRLLALGGKRHLEPVLAGTMTGLLFYEPSLRTRWSSELAARYLGGNTIFTEAAGMFSSAAKGEIVEHTLRVIASYELDLVVIRHGTRGTAEAVANISPVPIINAGDGDGEHPTQALLDLYTIQQLVKKPEIVLVLCGDLVHSRTIRSLCRLMATYQSPEQRFRLILCSPGQIRLGADIRGELNDAEIPFEETTDIEYALRVADVFYQTRVQVERFPNLSEARTMAEEVESRFRITGANVERMRSDAVIMHPLPIVNEIAPEVDRNPRARYIPDQTRNGLYIRMALLRHVLLPDG